MIFYVLKLVFFIEINLLNLTTVKLYDLKCQFQVLKIDLLSLGLLTLEIDIFICKIAKK